jgi:nicotinamidase-related amidase
MKISGALFIVDPQNDFCDPRGSLYVDGAQADMKRLANLIEERGEGFGDIYVSLDSHDELAIFHPHFWKNAKTQEPPEPYETITVEEFRAKKWVPANHLASTKTEQYFDVLASKNLSLTVWPEHCVVSTWGHQIVDPLKNALTAWKMKKLRAVHYIFKGTDPYSDQFSAFEGVNPNSLEGIFNRGLLAALRSQDCVWFAGEALTHCVLETIRSFHMASPEHKKFYLIDDCTSPVAGYDSEEATNELAKFDVEFVRCA